MIRLPMKEYWKPIDNGKWHLVPDTIYNVVAVNCILRN